MKLNPPLFYNIFQRLYELVLEALQAVAQLFWEQIGNYRTVTRTISVKLIYVQPLNVSFYGVTHVLKMTTVAYLGLALCQSFWGFASSLPRVTIFRHSRTF